MNIKYMMALALCALVPILSKAQQRLDLSLSECREMALAASEDMRLSQLDSEKADLDQKIAKASYFPKIDGMALGAYCFPDMNLMGMTMQMRGMYLAGISLTQPIYTGGRLPTGKKLAKIGKEAASIQQRMTRMDVILDADKSYWTYIAVAQKVKMLESYITQMDTLYSQIKLSVDCGLGTDNDLLRISSKRSEIRYQWQKATNGLDLCRLALCRILGVDNDTDIVPTDTAINIEPLASYTYNSENRPEIQLLQKQIEANRHMVTMERAEMLPTVGLSAGYSYYGNIRFKGYSDMGDGTYMPFSQNFHHGSGSLLLSVSIPIYSWGERKSKVKKARVDVENSKVELQKNSRLIDLQVEQATKNMEDAQLLILTAEEGMRQSDENLRIMKERFALSLSPLTDLLDAQSQWQQAASNLIEAKAQYKISEAEYLRALGILD